MIAAAGAAVARGDVAAGPALAGWLPAFVLAGVGYAATGVAYGALLQRETPPALMGRVAGAAGALTTALPLAAPPVVALLAARHGIGPVYAALGAVTVLLGLTVLLRRRSRATADRPPTEPLLSAVTHD